MMQTESRDRANERGGIILGFMGIALLVFMGLAVVAIDFGHLGLSTNEVQIVADTAATAGARSLMLNARNGTSENPVTVAQAVVGKNHVDDGAASIAASDIELGTYNFTTRSFTVGGASPNAVHATGRATVPNMIAGIFGDHTSDVQRDAIAAYGGNSSGHPVCPITIGLCEFQQYQTNSNCSQLPALTQVPSANDTSGFTSLGVASASASESISYLPAACGGGGKPPPAVTVGSTINVLNGQATSILQTVKNCWQQGLLSECVVPIVNIPCNTQFNQARPVVAFATFKITGVTTSGSNKGISLKGVCKTNEPGAPGGSNLGTFSMALVN
jgi:hypothetical protein